MNPEEGASIVAEFARLSQQRDALEAEIAAIAEELASGPNAPGLRGPLVDAEGFPRADIDVYRVRHQRHAFACKQTDHREIMTRIEKLLPLLFEARKVTPTPTAPVQPAPPAPPAAFTPIPVADATKQPAPASERAVAEKVKPVFAVVESVQDDSPAAAAALRAGDLVVSFGTADATNHRNLEAIRDIVLRNIGSAIRVVVRRPLGEEDEALAELRKMKGNNPGLRLQIEIIEKFLVELDKFILFPKIVQVPVEKIVEKTIEVDKIVRVPTQDERSLKMELTLSLLVEKLIIELKRLKRQNPALDLNLEDDVRFIFFNEFDTRGSQVVNEDLNAQLKTFADAIYRKFNTLGDWTQDHMLMLNSFLQERFVMANIVKNANLEIEKSRQISDKRLEGLRRFKTEKITY